MSGCPEFLAVPPLSLLQGCVGKASCSCLVRRPQIGLFTWLRLLVDSDLAIPEPPMCTRPRFGWRAAAGFRTGNSVSGAEAALPVPEEGSAGRIYSTTGTAFVTGRRAARP